MDRNFRHRTGALAAALVATTCLPWAFADRTGGSNAVVSGITHTSASFSASITTDAAGTGSFALAIYYKEASADGYLGIVATPASIAVNANATTTFSASTAQLACGKSYAVTGAYLPPGATQYLRAGSGDTTFSTLACASITPASASLKYFTGSAITPATLTTANFNGSTSFRISPALPAGLAFNTSTGAITGTPTAAKTATTHTITGTGAVSGSATATITLTIAPALTDLEVLNYVASQSDLIDAFGTNISRARQHYLDWGYNEGRKITFEPLYYTASHPDLMGAFGVDETKAVTHYIQWGFKEKRQVTFSALQSLRYIASHPDLIDALSADSTKGVRHYIQAGYKEGRRITFDALRYTASHPDLISAFGGDEVKAATHYIQAGYKEKRQTTFTDFDALSYIAGYADLITSLGANAVAGIRNYVETGYKAGRRIVFDALAYIASQSDLIAAFGTDAVAGVTHYINWGYKEGRKVVFDALGYLAAHSDLRAAFGTDTSAATRHYINWGAKEGRGYLWTVSATAGTGGQVSAARSYASTGERVSITVAAQTGYALESVSGCGGSLNGSTYTTAPLTGTCAISTSFKLEKELVISEISNCFYRNVTCWFEIHNRAASSISLGNYKVRATSVPVEGGTISVAEFTLPIVTVPSGGYVIVSGNVKDNTQRGTENILVRNGSLVPFWTSSNGFVEITKAGATLDFVLLGGTQKPTTSTAWSGGAIGLAAIYSADGYGRSVVRPFPRTADTDTDAAADWTRVDWVTPGGRNDVPSTTTDADNDGIPDSAEVAGGTYAGIDLHALGARLNQKDIFIEVDFMDSTDAGIVPKREALQKVADSFAAKQFRVHFDAGTTFNRSVSTSDFNLGQGSAVVPYERCVVVGDASVCNGNVSTRRTLYDWKYEYMELRRRAIFHYMLFGNSQEPSGERGSSGLAEFPGNDVLITLGGWGLRDVAGSSRNILINYQAGTVMHELGHNLGLDHGGNEGTNDKPNYWSVMNYLYQLSGLDPDARSTTAYLRWRYSKGDKTPARCDLVAGPCADPASFVISFSDGSSGNLDESKLLEKDNVGRGSNAGAYADWNMDSALTTTEQALDLNADDEQTVLKDYNDWGNLVLAFSRYSGGVSRIDDRVATSETAVPYKLDPLSDDLQPTISCNPLEGRSLR